MKYKLSELKKARDKAIEEGKDQFTFKDNELLVSFAKYLIQHLENVYEARGIRENVPLFEFTGELK